MMDMVQSDVTGKKDSIFNHRISDLRGNRDVREGNELNHGPLLIKVRVVSVFID